MYCNISCIEGFYFQHEDSIMYKTSTGNDCHRYFFPKHVSWKVPGNKHYYTTAKKQSTRKKSLYIRGIWDCCYVTNTCKSLPISSTLPKDSMGILSDSLCSVWATKYKGGGGYLSICTTSVIKYPLPRALYFFSLKEEPNSERVWATRFDLRFSLPS